MSQVGPFSCRITGPGSVGRWEIGKLMLDGNRVGICLEAPAAEGGWMLTLGARLALEPVGGFEWVERSCRLSRWDLLEDLSG